MEGEWKVNGKGDKMENRSWNTISKSIVFLRLMNAYAQAFQLTWKLLDARYTTDPDVHSGKVR